MKNILNPVVKQEILMRIDKMTPERDALWGKMNSAQALRHMSMAFQILMKELVPTTSGRKMPKWLMRFLLLKLKPPKEIAETFPEMNMVKNGIMPEDFEMERSNLKGYVERIGKMDALLEENALAGKFSRSDWGQLLYNHSDHHLRQFGV